jgi:hypothetical protein
MPRRAFSAPADRRSPWQSRDAILAFIGGFVLIGPGIAAQTAVRQERLAWAERRLRLADRVDLPLIILAGLTMAVGRYL